MSTGRENNKGYLFHGLGDPFSTVFHFHIGEIRVRRVEENHFSLGVKIGKKQSLPTAGVE